MLVAPSEEKLVRSMAALDAKNRFGELLDTAQREPVTIEKHGRAVAVMVSAEDYRELEALKLARLRGEIALGLDDIHAGRVVDGRTAIAKLKATFK
jgi:prevent-host-death family protein